MEASGLDEEEQENYLLYWEVVKEGDKEAIDALLVGAFRYALYACACEISCLKMAKWPQVTMSILQQLLFLLTCTTRMA